MRPAARVPLESEVVKSKVVEFVDTANPSLGIDCPRCGLWTARFGWFCRNCSFALWPSAAASGRAYRLWRMADSSRAHLHQWDDSLPIEDSTIVHVDFGTRAHQMGIHLFPASTWPVVVCAGFLFLGLAAVPFPPIARIVLAVIGVVVMAYGIGGWMFEDVRMFPKDDGSAGGHGGGH